MKLSQEMVNKLIKKILSKEKRNFYNGMYKFFL